MGPRVNTAATRRRLRVLAWLLSVAAILSIPFGGPVAAASDTVLAPLGDLPNPVLTAATDGAQEPSATTAGLWGPSFLPADSPVYLELRGDLSEGQGEALTEVMRRFPGFADAISLEAEIDAALEAAVREATDGALSWTADVRSWFSGQVAGGLVGGWASLVEGAQPSFLAGIEVTDPEAAMSFIELALGMAGPAFDERLVEETYAGATIVSLSDGDGAYALTDGLLLVGTGPDEVRIGLDVLAGAVPSLASAPGFRAAMARVPDARLAAGYVDLAPLRPLIEATGGTESSVDVSRVLDQLPLDLTFYVAARPDGAIYQTFVTPGPDSPMIGSGEPHLAAAFPASTQFLAETPDVGASITSIASSMSSLVVGEVRRIAGRELEPSDLAALGVLGSSFDRLVGWIDDVAVGAGIERGRAWVGIVIEGADDGAAGVYVGALEGLLAAGALAAAGDRLDSDQAYALRTTTVEGVEVVTVSFDAGEVGAGLAGIFEPSLSIAQDGDRLILGSTAFVMASLQLEPEESLASDPRYAEALAATGRLSGGHIYVDISGIRIPLEPLLRMNAPGYSEVAPYVEPFDRVALGYGVTDDGVLTMTLLLLLE